MRPDCGAWSHIAN